jgi:hypothetical protein
MQSVKNNVTGLQLNKIPRFVWVVLGLITAVYVGWHMAYPSGSLRYKMTVVVETPEGEKAGSAVREIAFNSGPRILPDAGCCFAGVSKGEAVAVDLGKHGILFALISGPQDVFDAFPPPDHLMTLSPEGFSYYLSLKTSEAATLLPKQYPTFVQFKDITDPMTVEQICERDFCDQVQRELHRKTTDFSQLGISVKAITVEITQEPVTWEIDSRLTWLKNVKMSYLNGGHSSAGAPLELSGDSFQRGNK